MTETDICNLALRRIGAAPIATGSVQYDGGSSAEVQACNATYALTRDRLLRSHPWNFASIRASLTVDATAPAFGWAKRYPLPAGCLRVLKVNSYDRTLRESEWCVEAGWLLTNETEAKIVYVDRVTDTTKFDSLFLQALVVLLASELAGCLTRGEDYRTGLISEYESIVAPLARRVDANEEQSREKLPYVDSDLVNARFGF